MGIAGAIRQIDPVQRLESELSVEEIRSRYDLEQLRCEWDSLQDQIRLPSLFLNIDWILNWWKHFGGNRQMLVLALRRGTKVEAILPLMKGRSVLSRKLGGPPVNTIESMTNFHSHEFDVISPDLRPSHVRLALDHLLKYHDFHLLRLGPLCEESPAWKMFQLEASRRNLSFTLSESHRTPYIPVGYDWGSFFQGLPRSLRRQIKKAQKLLDQGSISFQLARESRLITPMLDEMFELASKGWAAARGTAISSTPTLRDFYRDLALLAQRKGWLHFGLLRNRERLCAFEFNISYHGRLYGLKTAYDPAFSSIGPGHVLIWKILDSLFPGPHLIEEFDLGGTDAAYKLRWTSLTRTYSKMHLFNPASHYAQSLFQFECLLRKVQEALPKAQK